MALLDTAETCTTAVGAAHCHLAIAGRLEDALHGDRLRTAVAGWQVRPQRGDSFGERLARAHAETPGPVIQIGMDTPQVTVDQLLSVASALRADAEAVLGPAEDGGWWVLGLRDPAAAACLAGVEMSATTTYADTRAALRSRAVLVAETVRMRDVDTADDAEAVASMSPHTRFARLWATLPTGPR
jgi:glycosyltransferase A (GT-A) superfamily protein (DUF2064 family)